MSGLSDAAFHQLRHRYGTLAYQATRDLVAVGRQMGHSSPVTTAIFGEPEAPVYRVRWAPRGEMCAIERL